MLFETRDFREHLFSFENVAFIFLKCKEFLEIDCENKYGVSFLLVVERFTEIVFHGKLFRNSDFRM